MCVKSDTKRYEDYEIQAISQAQITEEKMGRFSHVQIRKFYLSKTYRVMCLI